MTTRILTTKLYIPPPQTGLVLRQRLVERLNAGMNRSLILVSAPAGYGKTTLLSDWARRSESRPRVAWISLDKGDNDSARFWAYFVAALGGLQAGLGENALALLHSPKPPPIETVLAPLINEIATIPASFTLVLDDYHTIESQPIHNGVAFLLDNIPPQMHLVIATRTDPPLPLPRMRGRGEVVEIRTDDLRFTPDEADTFFSQALSFGLSQEHVAALQARTEGWIVGLRMAALSMRERKDISGFIAAFTGRHRYILDYLVEEVLQQQTGDVQGFLLETSVLERFTAPLCNAVTGRDDSHDVLLALEHANLFIVPLDESRQWYRYEHLFATLLRHRLEVTLGKDHVELLQKRASQWHESNGFSADAVDYAIAAQDWERTAKLIQSAGTSFMNRGEVMTLLNWLKALPDDVLRSHLELCIGYSWALVFAGHSDAAEFYLAQAEQAARHDPSHLGDIMALQAYIARTRGDVSRTIELSERALSLLPKDKTETRCVLALNLGIAHWHNGHLMEAEQALTEANRGAQQAGDHFVGLTALSFLGFIRAARGKLHEAAELARQAVALAEQSPAIAHAQLLLSVLNYEWNELPAAADHIRRAIELSQRIGHVEMQCNGYRFSARIKQAQGDKSAALEALQKAHQTAREKDVPQFEHARNAAYQVEMALSQGDLTAALHWADKVLGDIDASPLHPRLGLTQARLLIARGEKHAAADELRTQYEKARRAGWQHGMVETRVLQALAAPTSTAALAFLADALKLSQPEGYVRTFVDEGEALAELLRQPMSQSVHPDYVAKLLAALEVEAKGRGCPGEGLEASAFLRHRPAGQPLVEPLSERELEVLRLVAAGLSNREIAESLIISVGTVKTHVHNILNKLNVQGRTGAIARARELDLI